MLVIYADGTVFLKVFKEKRMNRKQIAKIVASALQEQLGKLFPDFVKASKSIPANNDYERRYNANMRYVKETKRIDFGLNSTINFGFDVYISNPCFYIRGSDHPDEPFITLEFSNLQRKIDPKILAKIILFGLSTNFIYRVVLENDKNEEIVMAYAIDKVDMDTFYKINVYFKYLGDFRDLGLEEEG